MMIEQHYDEEVLIALLDEQTVDPHLQSCATCKSALHSIRQVTTALHDDAVWDRRELSEEPKPATRNALRSFASSVAAEDAAAEPWVKSLVARPSQEWRGLVDAHPEWKSAGFVRKLVSAVDAINFTAPTDAVELTKIAVDVAEALEGQSDRIAKVRASAWREYAYALYYVGSYAQSLAALDRLDHTVRDLTLQRFDFARSSQIRAYVLTATEKFHDAIQLATNAKVAFDEFGDFRRSLAMDMLLGIIMIRSRRFAEGLQAHLHILRNEKSDAVLRATAMSNAAMCYRELGNLAEAKNLLGQAIPEYERLGTISYRTAARWQLGSVLMAEGQYRRALEVFDLVREEYQTLGKAHDLALVYIDSAEALLLSGRVDAVADLCKEAIAYFTEASLTYTAAALTALAFMREAAATKSLTVASVRDVRSFFEILPKQPHLLFARPA